MVTPNLMTSLSSLKSNIFSYVRLATHVRYSHSFQCPSLRFRHNINFVSQLKSSSSKPRIASYFIGSRKAHSDSYQAIDTNISNNLLLWKHENNNYFRNLKIFVGVVSVCFIGLGYKVYEIFPSMDKYQSYTEYIADNLILSAIMVTPVVTVLSFLLVIWYLETKSLKYIILNKGGKMVTLVSFHPFQGTRSVVAPVSEITVPKSRADTGVYMTLKVKEKKLFYLIDKDGTFVNPQMFDVIMAAK